jgi:hypothetical protein
MYFKILNGENMGKYEKIGVIYDDSPMDRKRVIL